MTDTDVADRTALAQAYETLVAADVEGVAGFRLSVLVELAVGAPRHDPTRYSSAEIRLARALLLVAARAVRAGVGWRELTHAAE